MKNLLFFLLLLGGFVSAQTPAEISKINRGRLSYRTGAAGQTAVGQNILSNPAGTTAFDFVGTADSTNYNWIALQITTSGTISGGNVAFEGSNDGVTYVSCNLISQQSVSAGTSVGVWVSQAVVSVTSFRWYYGQIPFRYFRARISVAITGGGSIGASYIMKYTEIDNPVSVVYPSTISFNADNTRGPAANSAAVNGNPVVVASRAQTSHVTNDIANGDVTTLLADINNKTVVRPYSIGQVTWNYAAATSGISNTTTAVTVKAAGGAGIRNVITGMDVTIPAALGGTTELVIRDGASGTVLWRGAFGVATIGSWHYEFPVPIRGTAATLLEIATLTAVTGNIYVNVTGYEEY